MSKESLRENAAFRLFTTSNGTVALFSCNEDIFANLFYFVDVVMWMLVTTYLLMIDINRLICWKSCTALALDSCIFSGRSIYLWLVPFYFNVFVRWMTSGPVWSSGFKVYAILIFRFLLNFMTVFLIYCVLSRCICNWSE